MVEVNTEQYSVVKHIEKILSPNFKVVTNIGAEQHYIGGFFPDIIVMDKKDDVLFAIEVRRNGQVSNCIQQWKSASNLPATLYIVVPEAELDNAKGIAALNGLKAKFGTYKIGTDKNVESVKFL